ncbi:hypothetical protein DL89DRAFT_269995 [Linderina pennispora]|uniref:C2H2-type domain-containing protein n=1 Tax=Linderina pennispora TaxID=61395 RepID=A0A1Y1VYU1_9FUNG|nr:uncharacterized protein DL89DRAFT_269995 [Linderina pennispora]ORX66437.1 hypothetical protein DL89DRAFT_269995 [Linderina pennispora]
MPSHDTSEYVFCQCCEKLFNSSEAMRKHISEMKRLKLQAMLVRSEFGLVFTDL